MLTTAYGPIPASVSTCAQPKGLAPLNESEEWARALSHSSFCCARSARVPPPVSSIRLCAIWMLAATHQSNVYCGTKSPSRYRLRANGWGAGAGAGGAADVESGTATGTGACGGARATSAASGAELAEPAAGVGTVAVAPGEGAADPDTACPEPIPDVQPARKAIRAMSQARSRRRAAVMIAPVHFTLSGRTCYQSPAHDSP